MRQPAARLALDGRLLLCWRTYQIRYCVVGDSVIAAVYCDVLARHRVVAPGDGDVVVRVREGRVEFFSGGIVVLVARCTRVSQAGGHEQQREGGAQQRRHGGGTGRCLRRKGERYDG
jgi:hypothetical protein